MPHLKLGRTRKSCAVREGLLEAVRQGASRIVSDASERFGLSRQSIHKHLTWLVENDYLLAEGATRNRTYRLGEHRVFQNSYPLDRIDEHSVHQRDFSFIFQGLPDNVSEICDYGFTEMLNNAIDHSEGSTVLVAAERTAAAVELLVHDDGEGIFQRIARLLGLHDPRESLLELSKGKLTTDPDNHTGEGIFFTSRAFDAFTIASGDLDFTHRDDRELDFLLQADEPFNGTQVRMEIATNSHHDLGAIFDEYSSGPEEYRFERTVVPVRLALYEGERLLSRSQAKRILNRVEKFRHVILDFDGVDTIGQACADEVFRVFATRHPEIKVVAENETEQIRRMIKRALSSR
jgi:anti-sigma regulatory factor (Ser/Thr protein kinase)